MLTDNNASSDTISCDQTSDSVKVVNEDSDSVKSTSCVKEDQKDDEERLESKPKLKGKKAKDARKAKAKESSGAAEPVTVKVSATLPYSSLLFNPFINPNPHLLIYSSICVPALLQFRSL